MIRRLRRGADYGCGLRDPAAAEDAELGEKLLQLEGEQIITPIDGGAQGAMPGRDVSAPADQHLEAIREAFEHLSGCADPRPGGGEFERQRDAIEPAAQRSDSLGVTGRDLKVRARSLRAIHEELDAGKLQQLFRRAELRGSRQWRQREFLFVLDVERLPRCNEARQSGRRAAQLLYQGGAFGGLRLLGQKLFKIIQEEEGRASAERLQYLLKRLSCMRTFQ